MSQNRGDPTFDNLENLQEQIVIRAVRAVIEQEARQGRAVCGCRSCLVDIAAVALNSLPPWYVADSMNTVAFGLRGEEYARRKTAAEEAIRKAIPIVAASPHHEQ